MVRALLDDSTTLRWEGVTSSLTVLRSVDISCVYSSNSAAMVVDLWLRCVALHIVDHIKDHPEQKEIRDQKVRKVRVCEIE